MTEHARGTFEVTIAPAPADDTGVHRLGLTKVWTGDLAGTGAGHMLSAGDPTKQEAGYVALEVATGTLGGREGSLAFQQWGTMRPDGQEMTYQVVPGSGTGELVGIEGTLELDIADDGTHTYDLSYTLP